MVSTLMGSLRKYYVLTDLEKVLSVTKSHGSRYHRVHAIEATTHRRTSSLDIEDDDGDGRVSRCKSSQLRSPQDSSGKKQQ